MATGGNFRWNASIKRRGVLRTKSTMGRTARRIKVSTFTDESGQDTRGKIFVVCTAICNSAKADSIEAELIKIEAKSGKVGKWHDTGDKRKHRYIRQVLGINALKDLKIYFSIYENKLEYSKLVGAHIAKSIINYVKDRDYKAKIFIDKSSKAVLFQIRRERKLYRIRYQKVRGLSEKASALIRLADASCGLIRDLEKKNVANSYKQLFKKFREV